MTTVMLLGMTKNRYLANGDHRFGEKDVLSCPKDIVKWKNTGTGIWNYVLTKEALFKVCKINLLHCTLF